MQQIPENYPIEYIKGSVNFFGRDFLVTPNILIPRLETESLVRRARLFLSGKKEENSEMGVRGEGTVGAEMKNSELMSEANSERVGLPPETFGTFGHKSTENGVGDVKNIVIDIGCGSGIIGTSVADLADEVIFLDISPIALEVAERNFRTHFPEKKARFILSDLLSGLPPLLGEGLGVRCLFVTNLPYIRDEDWKNMSDDTIHEPRLALFGGEKTGFELYERFFEQFSILLPSLLGEGLGVRCLFEFGFDQREVAENILKKYPQWKYSFFADYAGVERFGEIFNKKALVNQGVVH